MVLFIDATDGTEDDQLTNVVKSCVDRSVYFPVAVNCCVRPRGVEELDGVTWIDES